MAINPSYPPSSTPALWLFCLSFASILFQGDAFELHLHRRVQKTNRAPATNSQTCPLESINKKNAASARPPPSSPASSPGQMPPRQAHPFVSHRATEAAAGPCDHCGRYVESRKIRKNESERETRREVEGGSTMEKAEKGSDGVAGDRMFSCLLSLVSPRASSRMESSATSSPRLEMLIAATRFRCADVIGDRACGFQTAGR